MRRAGSVVIYSIAMMGCVGEPVERAAKFGAPPATVMDMAAEAPRGKTALRITIRSSDDLQPLPCRVIFDGVRPTQAPVFHRDPATAEVVSAHVLGISDGVYLVTGEGVVPVPPGTYDLTVQQGPEYEQLKRRISIAENEQIIFDAVLEHSVRTDGWLAADMHIHSNRSNDAKLLPAHRVVSEVAAGVEVLVSTEHSWHHDLQPYVKALGYAARAVAIPGSEYGFASGHLGVYPVEVNFNAPLWGAPDWQPWPTSNGVPAESAFAMIHALAGQPLVIINHPRLLPDLGYFTNIGWPHYVDEPLSTASLFDGMEILNGYQALPSEISTLLRDWFFLLSGGHRIVGLGNSDTHRVDWPSAGYPRTWLRLATEEPARVLPSDLRDALSNMRAVASTGPFLQLRVDGHDIGDTVRPQLGMVTVEITADAAGWIDLSRVVLYHDGLLIKDWPIAATNRPHPALRVQTTVPVSKDGWLVAIAVGDLWLPPSVGGVYRAARPNPFAVTNPIWLDSDGDGKVGATQLVSMPMFFGADAQTAAPRAPLPSSLLHAPLDCEPDAMLDWLYGPPTR